MSILSIFNGVIFSGGIISNALADTAAATPQAQQGSLLSMVPMLVVFIAVFYFLMIRPQSKRAKEQRMLLDKLSVGDEVVTSGGVVGRINKIKDKYLVLTLGKGMEIIVQKSAIASMLPKGTIDAM